MAKKYSGGDLEEFKMRQRQMTKAFNECFSSPVGETVLAALKDEYYHNIDTPHTGEIAMLVLGRREVIQNILDIMSGAGVAGE